MLRGSPLARSWIADSAWSTLLAYLLSAKAGLGWLVAVSGVGVEATHSAPGTGMINYILKHSLTPRSFLFSSSGLAVCLAEPSCVGFSAKKTVGVSGRVRAARATQAEPAARSLAKNKYPPGDSSGYALELRGPLLVQFVWWETRRVLFGKLWKEKAVSWK